MEETPYYHVVSRCVRRAFLSGIDHVTGQSYEHRRQWIEDRIRLLSSIFAIDIAAYAVMSNHYHIVVKICPEQTAQWSNREVLERWSCLYKGPLLIQKALAGEELSDAEQDRVNWEVKRYRQRLKDLSWFMKCLNEPIARRANKEDDCTGHFCSWGACPTLPYWTYSKRAISQKTSPTTAVQPATPWPLRSRQLSAGFRGLT